MDRRIPLGREDQRVGRVGAIDVTATERPGVLDFDRLLDRLVGDPEE